MNRIILILAIVLYLVDFQVLIRLYPDVSKNYYVYLEFVRVRGILYELTIFWLFLLTYRIGGDKIIKSVCVVGMVLVSGSLIDKVVFKIHEYLISDIILWVVSLLLAVRTYRNERIQ